MHETALTIQDSKSLRRLAFGEGVATVMTAVASIFYGCASAAAWLHGSILIGTGLSVFCGLTLLMHRAFLRSYRAARHDVRNRPVFPVARILRKSRP